MTIIRRSRFSHTIYHGRGRSVDGEALGRPAIDLPVQDGQHQCRVPVGDERDCERAALGARLQQHDRGRLIGDTSTFSYGRSPITEADPSVGVRSPRNNLMAVLLPAPLGPSSPVIPCSTAKFTPSRAIVPPYRLVRSFASIIAAMRKLYTFGR